VVPIALNLPPAFAVNEGWVQPLDDYIPDIETWKRRVLRERDFSDQHDAHLHGV
jgi:hypothetical protein